MKCIMIAAAIAAIVGSNTAFAAADVGEFRAADGVYNVTFTQKFIEPTYGATVEGELIECSAKNKNNAKQEANSQFKNYKADVDSYPGARVTSTKVTKEAGEWVCRIRWTYVDKTRISGGKIVTESAAGVLVKGDYKGKFIKDGTLMIWSKSKQSMVGKKYAAIPYDDAVIAAEAVGKVAVGRIEIYDDLQVSGVGFGSAASDYVNTLSGQLVVEGSELIDCGYGSWQIQKDATCTKLAEQGSDLSAILAKEGAVEVADAE